MCSTCLTSASSPQTWPFTSSKFSETRVSVCLFWLAEYSLESVSSVVRLISLPPHRKRTMFQNIVNATEPMTDEKEAIGFISNNPTRKEIVMYVTDSRAVETLLTLLSNIYLWEAFCSNRLASSVPWLSVSLLQGHDDDRLWLVGYHQTLGGTEQGGWPARPFTQLIKEDVHKKAIHRMHKSKFDTIT